MSLNHPETIHLTHHPWKNCLLWNQSLMPERMGTTDKALNWWPWILSCLNLMEQWWAHCRDLQTREQGRRRLSSHLRPRHLPFGSHFPHYFISPYHFTIIYQYFEPWQASSGLETWIIWETLERTLAMMWKKPRRWWWRWGSWQQMSQ